MVSLEFFIDIKSFRSHYGPGVDSASNRNEYQEYFLGGKGGRCVRLTTYHHFVPLSRNLGTLTSWNPLGHSRPVTGLIYLYLYVLKNAVFITKLVTFFFDVNLSKVSEHDMFRRQSTNYSHMVRYIQSKTQL